MIRNLFSSFLIAAALAVSATAFSTELRNAGYSLIPAPQKVELAGGDVTVDRTWEVVSEAGGGHIAVRRLRDGARELHGLAFDGGGAGRIVLRMAPGTVTEPEEPELARQAYRIEIRPGRVIVAANAGAGLFYGVQSLLQLLKPAPGGGWTLPAGVITDWPALPLRFIHWDTKHHQDRIETLKRYIDWAAFFKVNAIGFEMEDKYEYPRHPIIGAPGAYTKAQMQELTAYARERFIQLVPQIQSPAHMAYVLKHEEFAHLRADGSNYQISMCNEEAMRLIEDMYQDMIEATPGVEYFHVSTDEVYYAGISKECQAQRPYNPENRSLTWVDYVNRMFRWLRERDRKMLAWVEYPLLPKHLELLPRGLINGVIGPGASRAWIEGLKRAGVHSLVYSSQQGSELLFPNYFSSDFLYRGRPITGRVEEPARSVAATLEKGADVIGTYAAAWDDSGLHCETFWLGWATVTQYGWTPETPPVEQSVADFMDVFYGPGNQDIVEIYRTLMEAARFYENTWDRVPATRLKPSYGSYAGRGRGTVRVDLTLEPPALPFGYDEGLIVEDRFQRLYAGPLAKAPEIKRRLDAAIQALEGKLSHVGRNRYNIEALLSIAQFEKHFVETLQDLARAERLMLQAAQAQREDRHRDVLALLKRTHATVAGNLAKRERMWESLVRVWEKSRYRKGRSVGGRHFVHILDDLKDHRADRRPGLDYLLEPFELIGLEAWNRKLAEFVEGYAKSYGLEQ